MEVPDVLEYPEYGGSKAERGLRLRLLQIFFLLEKTTKQVIRGAKHIVD